MSRSVAPDVLSWVKAEIDYALKFVRDSIAKFSAAPDDVGSLQACPSQIHQVVGALNIVGGLNGASRFCQSIESAFSGIGKGQAPSRKAVDTIDRAVLALKEFIDDISKGEPNSPLRLYPVYRELAEMQDCGVSEKDLFFPDLSRNAPAHPSAQKPPDGQLPGHLKNLRARFQRGLLTWLRKPADPHGLQEMRAALDALDQITARLPQPRSLWWAATGLVDGLIRTPQNDWTAGAKGLCGRIDLRIRDVAAGSQEPDEALLREVLYAVGKCPPVTPRIKAIKELYQLESLFPEPTLPGLMEFDMDWLQPALDDARSRLEAIKSAWIQYVSGEPRTLVRFHQMAKELKARVSELGNHQLARLLDVIALAPTLLPDPYPPQSQIMVMEMASAFLLAESVLDDFTDPPADLEQQVTIIGGWVLDASRDRSGNQPPAGLRPDLVKQISEMQLRTQVTREIQSNLQHVEQVLDAYSRDPRKRDSLPALMPHLRQIRGALAMLSFSRAAEALTLCEKLITGCAAPGNADTVQDMNWIAEGLSSVGFFLDPCLRGGKPAGRTLEHFFDRYEKRSDSAAAPPPPAASVPEERPAPPAAAEETPAPPAPAVTPPPAVAKRAVESPAPAPAPEPAPSQSAAPPVDEELLQVFLDEAQEVLAAIDESLAACRRQPGDREALTTIRRGFHTLKGSGRMVGLADLGEVAWEIEQVMNRWLEQGGPATSLLLELIESAGAAFSGWIGQLKARETLQLDPRAILDLAGRLKSGAAPEAPPAAVSVPAPAFAEPEAIPAAAPVPAAAEPEMPVPPAPPADVVIGAVRLSASFYDIFLKEARQHLAALETELLAWRARADAALSHEFMRAAHTLAGICRTAGFIPVADLAGMIEQWLPYARRTSAADMPAITDAIAKLKRMLSDIAGRQYPAEENETPALRDLVARLQRPEPPETAVTGIGPLPAPPAREAAAAPGDDTLIIRAAMPREQRAIRDDLDFQLLPIFLEEAQELVPAVGGDLRSWKAAPDDPQVPESLKRALHTLKGSARMAGAMRLGELAHLMETRVESALEGGTPRARLIDELESQMDRLSEGIERLRSAQAQPVPAAAVPQAAADAAPVEAPVPGAAAMLRINADTLDWLVNESGEIGIARSRMESEINALRQSLRDLGDSTERLRNQLREIEIQADSQLQSRQALAEDKRGFDPLEFDRYTRLQELTRMMAESLHDATTVQHGLARNLGEMDAALNQQARISRDVQQELMHIRTVPFANLSERLYRVTRQSARELDKKANLEIRGEQVELDRGVLEKVGAPLEHMLRNAVAHGLEPPAARVAAGKPEIGEITVTLRQESNEIVIVVSDDGAGLDLGRLRAKGLEKGLLPAEGQASDAEVMQLIFASGLSTAGEVTALAGRGVGMDVVRNEIASIGGRIETASVAGKGTTFTLYIPLTLAVAQAVLVRAGSGTSAVSSAMIEHVLRLKAGELASLYERGTIEMQGNAYPLRYLGHLLATAGGAAPLQPYNSVLLLRSGVQRAALHVDELSGNREIVIKNIGPQLSRVRGVTGATVLGDGRIVLIVNPVLLAQRAAEIGVPAIPARLPGEQEQARVVMVVDDSLTVRKVTGKLLEREGYRVLTAKDGLDALEQLKDTLPDIMLVDIEMPRMDGFDLTRNVRADARTAGVPIVIISSRTAEKHRNHALQLGASAFFGKPFQETELLRHIAQYVRARHQAAA